MLESREDPRMNQSGMIDMLEYHGYVQGTMLLDHGIDRRPGAGPAARLLRRRLQDRPLRHQGAAQPDPAGSGRPTMSPRFEKVPGTVVGNALPDILADIQDAANAALRSLVNNMSIASGPQVVVNDDRVADNENSDELYPWKRWHVVTDPLGAEQRPAADRLLPAASPTPRSCLVSTRNSPRSPTSLVAIPRYITGSERTGRCWSYCFRPCHAHGQRGQDPADRRRQHRQRHHRASQFPNSTTWSC